MKKEPYCLKISGNIDIELDTKYVKEQQKLFFEDKSTIKDTICNSLDINILLNNGNNIVIDNSSIEILDIFTMEVNNDRTILKFIINSKDLKELISDFDDCEVVLKSNLNLKSNDLELVLY